MVFRPAHPCPDRMRLVFQIMLNEGRDLVYEIPRGHIRFMLVQRSRAIVDRKIHFRETGNGDAVGRVGVVREDQEDIDRRAFALLFSTVSSHCKEHTVTALTSKSEGELREIYSLIPSIRYRIIRSPVRQCRVGSDEASCAVFVVPYTSRWW